MFRYTTTWWSCDDWNRSQRHHTSQTNSASLRTWDTTETIRIRSPSFSSIWSVSSTAKWFIRVCGVCTCEATETHFITRREYTQTLITRGCIDYLFHLHGILAGSHEITTARYNESFLLSELLEENIWDNIKCVIESMNQWSARITNIGDNEQVKWRRTLKLSATKDVENESFIRGGKLTSDVINLRLSEGVRYIG